MKKIISLFLALVVALSLASCGSGNSNEVKEEKIPDLTGEWKQVDGNSDDNYQVATIADDTIEIYWVLDGGDTKSLYWAGSFVAPTSTEEPYSWDSENNKEETEMSLLASGDDTKTFTYSDGQISYQASALGTTTTVKMEKQ